MVSPTAAITLYYDDRWMRESGVNLAMSLHGEQRNVFHRPIPPDGRGRVSSRITGIYDKGPGRGLVVVCEQVLRDAASGEPIATNVITNFARADGGIGFSSGPAPTASRIAESRRPTPASWATRARNRRCCTGSAGIAIRSTRIRTTAKAAGFPRPILHGMCSYGFAARAILQAACDYDAAAVEGHRRPHQRAGLSGRRTAHGDLAG